MITNLNINYEKILELEGFKVVDNSFLCSLSVGKFCTYNYVDECSNLVEQSNICDFFKENASCFITYPYEVAQEFRMGNVVFRRMARNLHKKFKIGRRVNGRHDERGRIRSVEMLGISQQLEFLVCKRRKMLKELLEKYPTERYIPSGDRWKESYLPSILEIAGIPGVKPDKSVRFGRRVIEEHEENDQKIFAKSLALSCFYPVHILTLDSDFLRIYNEFYRQFNSQREKYGFEIPRHELSIIYLYDRVFSVLGRDGVRRIV